MRYNKHVICKKTNKKYYTSCKINCRKNKKTLVTLFITVLKYMTNKEIRKVMKYKKDIICNTSLSTASNARKEFKREYEPMKRPTQKANSAKRTKVLTITDTHAEEVLLLH